MKKTLLTIAVALASFLGINLQTAAQTTKTFTDYLVVTINDTSSDPQLANIEVIVHEDGLMDFSLKNFSLSGKNVGYDDDDNPIVVDESIPVGNISLSGLTLTPIEGTRNYSFNTNEKIKIEKGTLEGVDMWMGPGLGEIPIELKGTICNEKLYVTIDIDMQESFLQQMIKVKVGTPIDDAPLGTSTKTYVDYLIVTINEDSSDPQAANIEVTVGEDGLMDFSLKNFSLSGKNVGYDDDDNPIVVDESIPVGNISLSGLALTPIEGTRNYSFSTKETIKIEEGTLEGVDMWMGPALGEIPIELNGIICNEKLYVTIDIDMRESFLQQMIKVEVGTPFNNTILFPEKVASHTITFIVDGETISSEELEEGVAVTAPEITEREGYTFYWRSEIPETMPGEDVEITGEYVINQYWVTFSIEGEPIYQELQEYGSVITVPSVPMREGYTFTWDQDIPETVPADHVTINGTYVVNQYPIKVMDVDTGEIIYEGLMDYGAEITLPTMEEREGYTFEWVGQNPDIMPAYEVILKGVYSANYYTCTWMLDGEFYKEMSIPYGEAVPDVPVEGNERYTFGGWNDVPETMPAHDIVIYGGMVDGVASAQRSTLNTQRTYNLAGMRVNLKHARGIIIVDGKKILKK